MLSPLVGATLIATQTGIFLYESVAKLVSAYPSRRWSSRSKTNVILHVCVAAGIALQIATLLVPGLRALLGLGLPNALGMLIVAVAIAMTWAFAELMGRTFGPGRLGTTPLPRATFFKGSRPFGSGLLRARPGGPL